MIKTLIQHIPVIGRDFWVDIQKMKAEQTPADAEEARLRNQIEHAREMPFMDSASSRPDEEDR